MSNVEAEAIDIGIGSGLLSYTQPGAYGSVIDRFTITVRMLKDNYARLCVDTIITSGRPTHEPLLAYSTAVLCSQRPSGFTLEYQGVSIKRAYSQNQGVKRATPKPAAKRGSP